MKNKKNEILKLLLFFAAILCSILLISTISGLTLPILFSFVAFFTIKPLVKAFERLNVSKNLSIGIIFLAIAIIASVSFKLAADNLKTEISVFEKEFPKYSSTILENLTQKELNYERKFRWLSHINLSKKISSSFQESGQKIITKIPDFASQLLSLLFFVPLFTFFLLSDSEKIHKGFLKLVPNKYFEMTYEITNQILNKMGNYISAKVIEALIVGIIVTLGLAIVKFDYYILLGIFAGVTNVIPYFGPIIGAAPGILLALTHIDPDTSIFAVTMVYVIANVIDFAILFPILMAKSVDLHPLLVVIAVVAGGNIMGLTGMIIAIPIAAIIKVLFSELYNVIYNNHDD